jgi:uracil-DNA glycosylase
MFNGVWGNSGKRLENSLKEIEMDLNRDCKGLATDSCTPTLDPRPTKEPQHTPTNKSTCMQRFVSGLDSGLT